MRKRRCARANEVVVRLAKLREKQNNEKQKNKTSSLAITTPKAANRSDARRSASAATAAAATVAVAAATAAAAAAAAAAATANAARRSPLNRVLITDVPTAAVAAVLRRLQASAYTRARVCIRFFGARSFRADRRSRQTGRTRSFRLRLLQPRATAV